MSVRGCTAEELQLNILIWKDSSPKAAHLSVVLQVLPRERVLGKRARPGNQFGEILWLYAARVVL